MENLCNDLPQLFSHFVLFLKNSVDTTFLNNLTSSVLSKYNCFDLLKYANMDKQEFSLNKWFYYHILVFEIQMKIPFAFFVFVQFLDTYNYFLFELLFFQKCLINFYNCLIEDFDFKTLVWTYEKTVGGGRCINFPWNEIIFH